MTRTYSLDLRERVVAAFAAGESCRAVAATFKVSVASVVKWSQRYRATGSAAARAIGGNRPYALASERDWLLRRLAEQQDITLRALLAELAERRIEVSYTRYGISSSTKASASKKRLHAAGQERPDVLRRRAQWRKNQGRLDPSPPCAATGSTLLA
jgi:transposase